MNEKRVKIPFPTPASPPVDGSEVQVKDSTERWSDATLEDGTTIRIKPNVVSAIRIDNTFDQEGNPVYAIRTSQVMVVSSSPAHLKKGGSASKGVN